MALPGPPELGRSVVVSPDMNPPEAWARCPRISVRPETLDDPSAATARLHQAWFAREPVVVELGVSSQELQDRETCLLAVHDLDPHFEFSRERLHFLVWANSYDARNGDPIWWHGRKAARRFADQGVTETVPPTLSWLTGPPSTSTADLSPPLRSRVGSESCTAGTPRPVRSRRSAIARPKPTWPPISWPP